MSIMKDGGAARSKLAAAVLKRYEDDERRIQAEVVRRLEDLRQLARDVIDDADMLSAFGDPTYDQGRKDVAELFLDKINGT